MADIISLADERASRSRSQDAAAVDADVEKLLTFSLLRQIAINLGIERGPSNPARKFLVVRVNSGD